MASTAASIGYGTLFGMADPATPTVFTYISEMTSITPPAATTDNQEATTMQSPGRFKEFTPGLSDGGKIEFDMNYVPGSATDIALRAARGVKKWCQIIFPNGVQFLFYAALETYQPDAKADGVMTAKASFKVSGEPAQTAAAAPINAALPTISGTAKVGNPLVLDTGIWGGVQSFTYQWKKTGTNIAGATSSTYVPIVGDVGGTITCAVTGVNSGFSTTVTTAATAAVAA
jgi:hypothetical protein